MVIFNLTGQASIHSKIARLSKALLLTAPATTISKLLPMLLDGAITWRLSRSIALRERARSMKWTVSS